MQSKGAERVTSGRNEKARPGRAVFCHLLPVAKGGNRLKAAGDGIYEMWAIQIDLSRLTKSIVTNLSG